MEQSAKEHVKLSKGVRLAKAAIVYSLKADQMSKEGFRVDGCGLGCLGLIVIVIMLSWMTSKNSYPTSPQNVVKAAPKKIDKSPAVQKQRKKLIEDAQRLGIIYKIEMRGTTAHVVIKARFHALSFEAKQSMASVIYLWAFDSEELLNKVVFRDFHTDKMVAYFSSTTGLKIE